MTDETKNAPQFSEADQEDNHFEYVNPADRWRWLHSILSIPEVGDFLAFCIAVAPLVIVMIALIPLGVDIAGDSGAGVATLIALVPTFLWLRLLERKAGLRLLLPIPIINIPIIWILPFVALVGILMTFGIA